MALVHTRNGDAAHPVTPDLGQGAELAMEDAAVLAALFGRLPTDQAIREYDKRRLDRAHRSRLNHASLPK